MLEIGSVVVSLKGHDKDKLYIVLKMEGDFAYLVDGVTKVISRPKKKRLKHLKDTFKSLEINKLHDFEIAAKIKEYNKILGK